MLDAKQQIFCENLAKIQFSAKIGSQNFRTIIRDLNFRRKFVAPGEIVEATHG
jgi:hypothetical protein